MAVHAVTLVTADAQKSTRLDPLDPLSIPGAIQDRITNNVFDHFTEVLPEQAMAARLVEYPDASSHVKAVHRVDGVADKATVLDDMERQVQDMEWYEVRYHQCVHDEQTDSSCGEVTAERTGGSVPDHV